MFLAEGAELRRGRKVFRGLRVNFLNNSVKFCGFCVPQHNHTDFLTEEQKDILFFTRETYFCGGTQNPRKHTDFF